MASSHCRAFVLHSCVLRNECELSITRPSALVNINHAAPEIITPCELEASVTPDTSYLTRVLKNSDSGCSKRSQMRGAREIDERRRICRYVKAKRSSATKQVSLFHL